MRTPGNGSVSLRSPVQIPEQRLDPILGSLTPDTVNAIWSIAKKIFDNFEISPLAQRRRCGCKMVHRLSPSIHPAAPHRRFQTIRHPHHRLGWYLLKSLRTGLCAGNLREGREEEMFVIGQRGTVLVV